jgi:hypothetical protein
MQVSPTTQTTSNPQSVAPVGSPIRHRAFTVIWIATVVANSLPMFLFAIPAELIWLLDVEQASSG